MRSFVIQFLLRRRNFFATVLTLAVVAAGAMPSAASAQAVTQAYNTDTNSLQRGMIVRLDDKDSTKVVALTTHDLAKMEGVVVAANDTPVTLSANSSVRQVYVAASGHYDVLVSTQDGAIKSGDYITISSLAGVGMKASSMQALVLGKALAGFDGTAGGSGSSSLTNAQGQKTTVSLGLVPVDINITHNQAYSGGSYAPGFLQKAGETIAGKPVDALRIYVSLAVLLVAAVIAGSLLYGGVRSSIISIGRNPLARASVMRNLFQVILTSLIIFILGLFGVYLLLKL